MNEELDKELDKLDKLKELTNKYHTLIDMYEDSDFSESKLNNINKHIIDEVKRIMKKNERIEKLKNLKKKLK